MIVYTMEDFQKEVAHEFILWMRGKQDFQAGEPEIWVQKFCALGASLP